MMNEIRRGEIKMNIEKIDKLQFLHQVKLTDTAKSILQICDGNEVLESDILTLSSILYLISRKARNERLSFLREFVQITSSQLKKLSAMEDLDGEMQKILGEGYYKKIPARKTLMSMGIAVDKLKEKDDSAASFMQFYLEDYYRDYTDERLTKRFIDLIQHADFQNAVRLYFLAIMLGRKGLIDKFSRIQRDKCRNNFIYALNREVTAAGTVLVRYGRKKNVELLSEQTIELSNDAVDETNRALSELRVEFDSTVRNLQGTIRSKEQELSTAHHEISKLRLELSEINNQLILDNMKVVVFGDDGHIEGYREKVEKHGGIFSFASGTKTKGAAARRIATSADIIFLITRWAQHELSGAIEDFENIIPVNSAGIDSLEREILKLRKKG